MPGLQAQLPAAPAGQAAAAAGAQYRHQAGYRGELPAAVAISLASCELLLTQGAAGRPEEPQAFCCQHLHVHQLLLLLVVVMVLQWQEV